jgi:hypothetical protein
MANSLPVYRLSYTETDFSQTVNLAQNLFKANDNFEMSKLQSGGHSLGNAQFTLETSNGGLDIWASDKVQRWNPTLRPQLLKETDAIKAVSRIVQEKKLLPSLQKPFEYAKPQIGGTYFSIYQNKKRENHQLDTQVVYPMLVNGLPIVGGRGDFMVSIGDKGQLTGFSGGGIAVSDSFNVETYDKKYAEGIFRDVTKSLNVESFDSYLAYHAGHVFDTQEYLYPVMVFRASIKIGKQKVALRNIIVPATEFGPKPQKSMPQSKRKANEVILKDIAEKNKVKRNYQSRSLARALPWEAGTSWIGESGGLGGSKANAQGFVDEWRSAGWKINFNWGDANAWESDWRRNDDSWVDAADFVFYTGHANMNGWVLANPDDGFLDFSEIGNAPQSPGDLWGQNDLEWAIIAACGPLQDDILYPGGGDVLSRWDGVFDGMHILMGYGGVTFDNTDEGRKVSQYAKQGNTLIQSWFRAAQEIQPATNGYGAPDGPNIYVGAMWASKQGADPYNDHAWGYGSVSNDPTSPTSLAAMWTLC